MADKRVAVANCTECPALDATIEQGWWCGIDSHVLATHGSAPPTDCPLRQGRVILFLNEKREG